MKVGIIDSGRGGKYIGELLQQQFDVEIIRREQFFFRSYSDMNMDDLILECDAHLAYLKENKVELVVIGCMTLSTNLVKYIERNVDVPIVDMYSNLPELPQDTLILGTTNTINSNKFDRYTTMPVPDISSSIEKGYTSLVTGLLRGYEMGNRRADLCSTILLGCSHYSIVRKEFEEYYKGRTVIDPVDYLIEDFKEEYEVVINCGLVNV